MGWHHSLAFGPYTQVLMEEEKLWGRGGGHDQC